MGSGGMIVMDEDDCIGFCDHRNLIFLRVLGREESMVEMSRLCPYSVTSVIFLDAEQDNLL